MKYLVQTNGEMPDGENLVGAQVAIPMTAHVLVIENCGQCPYVSMAGMGKKPVCAHPVRLVEKPYGDDRRIDLATRPQDHTCPYNPRPVIEEKEEEVLEQG